MKKRTLLIILGVLGIVLVGMIGLALAFAIGSPSRASTASGTPVPTETAVVGTSSTKKVRKVTGIIQSLGTQSFVIKGANGKKTTTITVDNKTKYSAASGSISFSDLQVGNTVQVRGTYDQSSQTILAQRVTLEAPTGSITAISSQSAQNSQTLTLSTTDNKTVTLHMTSTTSVLVQNIPVSHSFLVMGQMISYDGTTGGDGSITATTIYLDLTKVTGTVNGLSSQNVLSIQPTSSGTGSTASPVSVNLTAATVIAQSTGKKASSTPTVTNPTAIKMSAKVVVYDNSKLASGTPTAVLVIVSA